MKKLEPLPRSHSWWMALITPVLIYISRGLRGDGNIPGHAHSCLSLHWGDPIASPSKHLLRMLGKAGKLVSRVSLKELQANHRKASPCPPRGDPGERDRCVTSRSSSPHSPDGPKRQWSGPLGVHLRSWVSKEGAEAAREQEGKGIPGRGNSVYTGMEVGRQWRFWKDGAEHVKNKGKAWWLGHLGRSWGFIAVF